MKRYDHSQIADMLKAGHSASHISLAVGCSKKLVWWVGRHQKILRPRPNLALNFTKRGSNIHDEHPVSTT